MAARDYSFIDIAVLDDVRERFAAGDALAILSTSLEQAIWTNGPGATMLGHTDIASAIDSPAPLPAAARRQVMATSNYPRIGRDRSIGVRLASGMTSRMIGFLASAITLPDGEDAILLSVPAINTGSRATSEIAERAISGLDEPGSFVALLDAAGQVAAASAGFDRLGIPADTLAALAGAARNAEDRLVKRLVPVGEGRLPMGIARLVDNPAIHLLVVVDETEDVVEDEVASTPEQRDDPVDVLENTAPENVPHRDEPTEAVGTAESETSTLVAEPAGRVEQSSDSPGVAPDARQPSPDGSWGPAAVPLDQPTGEHDEWYFNADDTPVSSPVAGGDDHRGATTGRDPSSPPPAGFVAPPVDRASAPVRFVWRTDANGQFSTISEEFAQAVGKPAADILGRSFRDVADAFGLDPSHEIAALLERRDTWSGRSVLWPVAGTDLRIPVDLAALPVYGRDRNFEGFRGFGVARAGDAVIDPDGLGLDLMEGSAPVGEDVEQQTGAPRAEDPFKGEIPALSIVPKPDRRHSDKVIKLAEHRPPALDKGLTQGERTAFREIGDRLKKDGATTPNADNDQSASSSAPTEADRGGSRPVGKAEEPKPTAVLETQLDDLDELAGQIFGRGASSATTKPEQTGEDARDDVVPGDISPGVNAGNLIVETDGAGGLSATEESPASEENGDGDHDEPHEVASQAIAGSDVELAAEHATSDLAAHPDGEPTVRDDDLPEEANVEATSRDADQVDTVAAASSSTDETADTPPSVVRAELSRPTIPTQGFLPSAFAERDRHAAVDTSILDKLPIPVLIHAGDTLHYANREFLEFTAYDSVEHLADSGGIGELFAEPFVEDGPAADRKLRLRRGDGLEFPVEAFLQSVRWGGGKALMLALKRVSRAPIQPQAGLSVPERAELEARLAEMRTIIDTATDGVVLIGKDGTILSISRPAEALFGFDSGDVAGKPFTALFAIESQRAARDYLGGLSDNGVASVLNDGREVIGREAQGRFIPLFMTIGKLPGDSGYCAVVRDITQWKRAEEELTQSRAQAERASSQKTDFLARVSHEIRTPLNAIIGFSELMIDEKFGPIGNDRYRDYLRDINRSGNHVLDLVNDLLDISKIEAGEQEMAYEAVSLNDTLSETVAMMQPQANRERVIIRSSFASRLPEVVADLRSVRQIALNLLSNAVRYTQAGGQVIVSTSYEASGDIVMRVRDTGIGMTQGEIEQALKPFKQINALKRGRGDGTGLGLPLTKAMVEANRAKFTIISSPGEGTLVEVTFPSTRVLAD